MIRAAILAGAVLALAFSLSAIAAEDDGSDAWLDQEEQAHLCAIDAEHCDDEPSTPTACETDSECLLHCPPPADDPDCDGGPQEATPGRGNYGTQP
jgi:hypothetical protein